MTQQRLLPLFTTLTLAMLSQPLMAADAPTAKFSGETVTNPNRANDADATLEGQAKMAAKYIAGGDTVGIYDIWFAEQSDQDGDGYHSKFKAFFDIDSRYSNHRIYVTGQLSGNNTTPLFRTDPFTVSGETGNDTYSTTVLLTSGYPSGQYDLTLRVYDAQSNALLLTWGPQQDGQMSQLFLEDASRDAVSNADLQVFEFAYTLHTDHDGDGYFTEADVRIDVDAPQQARHIYASLFLVDQYDHWIPLRDSPVVSVSGYSAADRIHMDFVLDSGFDPQHYRLGAQIFDADSHNLLLTTTTPSSAPARMESGEYDRDYYHDEDDHYDDDHSGGSTGLVLLTGLIALWRGKKRKH